MYRDITDLATFSCHGLDWRSCFDAVLSVLRKDGVLMLQNVFTASEVKQLQIDYDRRWNAVRQKLERLQQQQPDGGDAVCLADVGISSFEEGRYEFSLEGGMFDAPDPQPIRDIVEEFFDTEYIRYTGGLPSLQGSADGEWHRDVYSLFGDDKLERKLPLFYLTIMVPLTDISFECGPTEFLLESHRLPEKSCKRKAFGIANVRDAIVFNGRVQHRGTSNKSREDRKIAYIVHCKKWYNEY